MLATGSRTQFLYIPESVFGATPSAPNMQFLSIPSAEKLKLEQSTLVSKIIRSDRQIDDVRLGNYKVSGGWDQEIIYGQFDFMLQSVLGGAWSLPLPPDAAPTLSAVTAGALTGGPVFVKITYLNAGGESGPSAEATITLAANKVLSVASPPPRQGYTTYNVYASATTGTETLQSLAPVAIGTAWQEPNSGLVSGAALPSVVAATLQNGTNKYSLAFEAGHVDIGQYLLYNGVTIDSLAIDIKPNKINSAGVTVLGQALAVPSGTSAATTTNVANSNSPMDAFSGVLKEGGSAIGYLTGVKLDLKNGDEAANVLGSRTMLDYFQGRLEVTGEITGWFEDGTLLTKWINGTESSLEFSMWGTPTNKTLDFLLPRTKYLSGEAPTNTEKGITQTFKFQALYSSSSGYTVLVTRSNN